MTWVVAHIVHGVVTGGYRYTTLMDSTAAAPAAQRCCPADSSSFWRKKAPREPARVANTATE